MSEQAEYNLDEPFDIDNGELDGLTLVQAFVLGCEWWHTWTQLDSGESIGKPIHAENSERIKRMLVRRGRRFKVGEAEKGWRWLEVQAK